MRMGRPCSHRYHIDTDDMLQYGLLCIALVALCYAEQHQDHSREVEAIDPGLLSNRTRGTTLGKQFNNNYPEQPFGGSGNNFGPDGSGSSLPRPGSTFNSGGSGSFLPNQGGFNGIGNGVNGGNFIPNSGGSFLPNSGGGGSFIPNSGGGSFIPNSGGGAGIFPGSLPGPLAPTIPPPGSVAADTVAFSVNRASDYTRVDVTQVRFENTIADVGYGWYPDRSEFVCYYPGLYFFTFSGLSSQTRPFKLSLVRNNQEVVSAWGDQSGYQTGSSSAIVVLTQGDRVYLVLQEGSLHEGNNPARAGYTTFSGFRIR